MFKSSLSSKFWVSCLAVLGLILFCPVNSAFLVCLAANILGQGSESMATKPLGHVSQEAIGQN